MNNRDHRKITVIDGKVGFTGGYNLANEYFNITHPYGHWKDTGIRLEGDAVKSLYERHARIGSATRAAVKEAGLKLHLQSGYSNTVTVFDIPECTDAKSILDEMRTKYKIMLAGSFDELSGKVIRIGHMGENARFP